MLQLQCCSSLPPSPPSYQSRGYGGAAPAAPQLHLLCQLLCCSSCSSHNAAASALQLLCYSLHCSCPRQCLQCPCSGTAPARQLLCCTLCHSRALQHEHRLHSATASARSWFPLSVVRCNMSTVYTVLLPLHALGFLRRFCTVWLACFSFCRSALRACAVRTAPRSSLWKRLSASVAGTKEQGPRPNRLTLAQHCLYNILVPLFIHHVNSWCRAPRGLGPSAALGWTLGVRVAAVCGVLP